MKMIKAILLTIADS